MPGFASLHLHSIDRLLLIVLGVLLLPMSANENVPNSMSPRNRPATTKRMRRRPALAADTPAYAMLVNRLREDPVPSVTRDAFPARR